MQIRTDRGWIKAGLAVLVTGLLGGGVLAAAGSKRPPHKVTADGVTGKPVEAPANRGFDLGAVAPAAADEAPEPKADPAVGDKVAVGSDGGSVTVSGVEDNVIAGRLFGAGEGQKYIAAEVKGCSGPHEKNLSFEPGYFLLRLDDGTMHDSGPPVKKPSLDGGGVPAGKCLSGWVTFVVKEGSLPTGVIYDGSSRLTWTVPLPKNAKPTTTTTSKAGATTTTTDGDTTSSTKPKTTSTTARGTTATTSKSSTTTTGKTTATTGKSGSTTTTTKSSGSTTTTGRSASATTTSTSAGKSSGSTDSTTSGKSGTTTTTGRSVVTAPADQDG